MSTKLLKGNSYKAEEDVDETVERKLLKGLLRGNADAGPHGPYV